MWNDAIVGALVILLAFPRGRIGERYGGFDRFIRQLDVPISNTTMAGRHTADTCRRETRLERLPKVEL